MAEIELKPCPFCGEKAEVRLSLGRDIVSCTNCHAEMAGSYINIDSLIEEWNTREYPAVNRWISVEDALPELDTMVIVCYYGSDFIMPMRGETVTEAIARQNKVPTVTMGFLSEEGWNGADMFPMMVQPTFWMNLPDAPLPEPPEKGVNCNARN